MKENASSTSSILFLEVPHEEPDGSRDPTKAVATGASALQTKGHLILDDLESMHLADGFTKGRLPLE